MAARHRVHGAAGVAPACRWTSPRAHTLRTGPRTACCTHAGSVRTPSSPPARAGRIGACAARVRAVAHRPCGGFRAVKRRRFLEKSVIEGIQMSPSVFSVAGVGTSSFGLVGTTTFCISGGDSAVSCVSFQLCERSDVPLLSDVGYHGYSAGRGVDPSGGAPGCG
ncbi:FBD-associated F-box protein [Dorcoceras hygrometricum]|uniref:FBD-associated F-box protein n=1 Tax=Dorcoceras hygrometricum TaxID=472368 RepID=A0A2Z7C6B4_9LAMI|nr:FBD-associated F-box protein [Dorcoceras hygrometricum]